MKDIYPTLGSCGKDPDLDNYYDELNAEFIICKELVKKDCFKCAWTHCHIKFKTKNASKCKMFIPEGWEKMEYKNGVWNREKSCEKIN